MPSSVIKRYNYEPQKHILYITFTSGITYAYKSVPLDIVNMLKVAESKGKYFNRFIKGRFKYSRLRSKSPKKLSTKSSNFLLINYMNT